MSTSPDPINRAVFTLVSMVITFGADAYASNKPIDRADIEDAMLKATTYMVETVSINGGYVWHYLPDLSRRWGEMEAYKTMIWVQHPGTVSMGHVFLDAYRATQNEYYYQAAEKAAAALIWGQSHEGGWHYMIDFAGDRSMKQWYDTIGKNGWRLEEFQHYYGNSTFDDDVTSNAARFLLRMYLEKLDPSYKPALDKAIQFILESQFPNGAWPQRYPLMDEYHKNGNPDYSSFYTFNDDVIWENVHFLIQCYLVLGEKRFLDPIHKGMEFYLTSLGEHPAWAQQYTHDMKPAGARTYEPAAFLTSTTVENAFLLLKFYTYTGDQRYLKPIPRIISWLEKVQLPPEKIEGQRTHPTYVEIGTDKAIFVHRKGSNVKYGSYFVDYNDAPGLGHSANKRSVDLVGLKQEYQKLSALPVEEIMKDSPLLPAEFTQKGTPQSYYDLNLVAFGGETQPSAVQNILATLDAQHRWLTTQVMISNPYIGEGQKTEETLEFADLRVGDETDTSPYPNSSEQEFVSTRLYIQNMQMLIQYLHAAQ